MSEPWVILETSGRGGRVGLAVGGVVVGAADLDAGKRHNRDLVPAIAALLGDAGVPAKQLHGVMVGVGPGSFTGLRVGLMTAKALAYATGCRLVAVPTFAAIAEQTPAGVAEVDVISDGLQGHVYAQKFRRTGEVWEAADELRIEPASEWAGRLADGAWVTGPGLDVADSVVPAGVNRVPPADRVARVGSVFAVGLRLPPATRDEMLRLEPLYLRPSSAEEKANREGR